MKPQAHPQAADVLLTDGTIATIRALRPSDAADLFALHDGVSDEATRMRFFTLNRHSGHAYTSRLVAGVPETRIALVAHRHDLLLGLASAEIDGTSAEVSFLVADAVHGLGLGTLLLEHLAAAARAAGIRTFTAEVLAENYPMISVFKDAGYAATRRTSGGIATWEISTEPSEPALEAADHRDRVAETRSLRPLLYPRSIAVVGVRRDGEGIGNAVLRSVEAAAFTGSVHVVHPTAAIGRYPARRSLREIPEHIDVAVIAVPATSALGAVTDAAEAGASAAVIITSGFGELGPDGARLEREIVRVARDHGMRLVGPNCLGLLCNDETIRLNATFSSAVPPPGSLAIASQSGGVGIALLDLARELGVGVHSFVSLGNQPDVGATDLLAAWHDDPRIAAGALYLESFGDPARVARLARRFSENKPLLAVAGGRSAGGARAGASHTASAATPTVGIEALFAQAGVINCRSAEELIHASRMLTEQPRPRGDRVAIVSNAGGIAILAADSADELGLAVPELSEDLKERIRRHLNGTIGVGNPIDLGAAARPDDVAAVVELLTTTDEVDAVLVAIIPTTAGDPQPYVSAVTRARTAGPDVPVVLVAMGGLHVAAGQAPGVTVFRTAEEALTALDHAVRYTSWLSSPRGSWPPADPDRAHAARRTASELCTAADDEGAWLAPQDQARLLSAYDIVPVGEVGYGSDEVARIAERIGFPVVVKVADPEVVHKTDRGLVRVGLSSTAGVLEAVGHFEAEMRQDGLAVLVQPVLRGVELAFGVVRHETFGPLIMVAAGGVATDLWQDRTFLMPPITEQDAERALRSLRIWPLLQGYRGSDPVDIMALQQLIVNLATLVGDVPEIHELDLNPVLATPVGAQIVDIKVRVRAVGAAAGSAARQLSAARRS